MIPSIKLRVVAHTKGTMNIVYKSAVKTRSNRPTHLIITSFECHCKIIIKHYFTYYFNKKYFETTRGVGISV